MNVYTILNFSWIGQAIYVATQLGVLDRLTNEPCAVDALAEETGAQKVPLFQVLRALGGTGFLEFLPDGRVQLGPMGREFVTNEMMRSYVLLWGQQLYFAGGRMLDQVRTGKSGFELEFGDPIWAHYSKHPEAQRCFDEFMNDATRWQTHVITTLYPFRNYRNMVDVGSGRGALLVSALAKNPHLRGIWYDRPETLPEARPQFQEAGVEERCEFLTGNFLKNVPEGADLYTIKHVLHDWSDDKAAVLLGNVARAMRDDSRLVIIEAVMNEANGADFLVKARDLEQMFWTGGRTRSRADFENLLTPQGLKIHRILPTHIGDVTMVEVVKSLPS